MKAKDKSQRSNPAYTEHAIELITLASNSLLKDTLIFIQVLEGRFVSELTRDVAPWGE